MLFVCYDPSVAKASSIETGSGDLILNLRYLIGMFLFNCVKIFCFKMLVLRPNNLTEKLIYRSSLISNIYPMNLILSSEGPPSTLIYLGKQTFFYVVISNLKANIIFDKVNYC